MSHKRYDPNQDVPMWRHVVDLESMTPSLTPGADYRGEHVRASLQFADHMYRRFTNLTGRTGMFPGFALGGPAAAAVVTGNAYVLAHGFDVIVAHATPEQFAQLFRGHFESLHGLRKNVVGEMLDGAAFVGLEGRQWLNPARNDPSSDATPIDQAWRGYRILMHSALRTVAVSRIRIQRSDDHVDYVSVPLFGPDGLLLASLAQLGQARAYTSLLCERLAMTPNIPEPIRIKAVRELKASVARTLRELRRFAATEQLVGRTISTAFSTGYPPVSDPFYTDPSVKLVIAAAFNSPSPLKKRASTPEREELRRICGSVFAPLPSEVRERLNSRIMLLNHAAHTSAASTNPSRSPETDRSNPQR